MPSSSADKPIPDLDDFDFTPTAPPAPEPEPAPQPVAADGEWFSGLPSRKTKKKIKRRAAARAWGQDDNDISYAKSITPSPPTDYGSKLRLRGASPPAQEVPSPSFAAVPDPEPVPEEQLVDWRNEPTAVEEPEEPAPRPPPPASPILRSPRPPAATLASPAASPSYRPATLYHPPPQEHASRANSRPQSSLSQAAPPPQTTRRESFAKQASPRPYFVEAPLPHLPQAHFFGLPDLGLGLMPKQEHGQPAGSDGYCCRFDTFSNSGDAVSAKKAKDALLVGSEGGLDVYRILPDKLEVVGRLEGLRGGVIDAKIIPHTRRFDAQQALRPLVVIIVHGPTLDERQDLGQDGGKRSGGPRHYQTTVEVYSLQTQQHVDTLYESTPIPTEVPVMGHLALPPPPAGDLSLDAKATYITVASGKSGEIFVFSCDATTLDGMPEYRCIGKVWTCVQTKVDHAARPASAGETEPDRASGVPLLSLSDRWLVMMPPYSSASISIEGSPTLLHDGLPPVGFATHTAPIQPPITCEIAGVDAEGTLSWLSRKAAQGLVKASQRGYEMGVQGWRELTHPAQLAHQRTASNDRDAFPPTMAPFDDPKRFAKEPALVSIIDLHSLRDAEEQKQKQSPTPLATFALVEGCNHLSFSPDGLRLLTSDRKGEVSSIWDLQRLAHGSPKQISTSDDEEVGRGPQVKLIQRIARSSPSIIIDSTWSRDGDWLSLLTANGTVHLHEIASSPSQKKRKRRSIPSAPVSEKAEPTVSMSQGVSPPSTNSDWSGYLRSSLQTVSTQVSSVRSRSGPAGFPIPTTFAGIREATAAAGTAGSRAVAKGLSQGFNAAKGGASDIWHADDNKIRHKILQEGARASCQRWAQRHSGSALLLVCAGTVHIYPVQRVTRRKGDLLVVGLKHDKYAHKAFALPRIGTIRDELVAGSGRKAAQCAQQGPHGFWSLRHAPLARKAAEQLGTASGAAVTSRASEVETNPPYCPFHVDSRVSIFAFDDRDPGVRKWQVKGHGVEDEEAWLFGEPLPASTRLNDGSMTDGGDVEDRADDGVRDDGEWDGNEEVDDEGLAEQMESRLTVHEAGDGRAQEIRVNTRRSPRGANGCGATVEDGGFEMLDDDDDP